VTVPNTWEGVGSYASSVGAKYPAVVSAQWALESAHGQHTSAKHNYFGLKGDGTISATKEFYGGQWVEIKAGFIDFPSLAASIDYLVRHWHLDWRQYKGVNNASSQEDAAKMLQNQGYATDPSYASKLIRLLHSHKPLIIEMPKIRLTSAAKYYREENHQMAAWNWLQEELSEDQLTEFAEIYRSGPPPKPANPLPVPYFSQRDNISGTGYRECFSSSCAMIAAYYGKVVTDDEYNSIRSRYGDTTSAYAQEKALQHLGLTPVYRKNASRQDLESAIKAGQPVAVGWLHHGYYKNPRGSGHWATVIGYDGKGFIFHDPNGFCDVIDGVYKSSSGGNYARYSNQYWMPRWCVKTSSDGWAMFVTNE